MWLQAPRHSFFNRQAFMVNTYIEVFKRFIQIMLAEILFIMTILAPLLDENYLVFEVFGILISFHDCFFFFEHFFVWLSLNLFDWNWLYIIDAFYIIRFIEMNCQRNIILKIKIRHLNLISLYRQTVVLASMDVLVKMRYYKKYGSIKESCIIFNMLIAILLVLFAC